MALDTIPKQEGGKLKAVASGTLPSGQPVIVNADGTVGLVVETTNSGSETLSSQFALPTTNGQQGSFLGGTYDSVNQRAIITYRDADNSGYGTAVVGTVGESSVTWGTPVVFDQRTQWTSAAFDSVNGKVVISYQDQDNSFYGTSIVGTVSGNSISFGTPVVFQSSETSYIDTTYDVSAGAIVVNYAENTGSGGRVVAGTVSGNSITFGSPVQFGNTGVYGRAVYHPEEQCTIIAWRDNNPSTRGSAIALTVSGTTITLGTKAYYLGAGQANQNDIAYDSDSKKIVIICRDEVNATYGSSIVGTVSGTTLTFASPVTFQSGAVDWMGIEGWYTGGVVMTYDDQSSGNKIILKYGTISGTTISWGTGLELYSGTGNNGYTGWSMATDVGRLVIAYNANSDGKYRVYNPTFSSSSTNLTSENYIGMSGGVVATETQSEAIGTESTFETGEVYGSSSGYHVAEKKTLLMFQDQSDSGKIKARLVTTTGTTLSYGSIVELTGQVGYPKSVVYDSVNEKLVVIFRGNTNYSYAVVATISGNSLTFGTPVVFESSVTTQYGIYDSTSGKVVVSYEGSGGGTGYLKVGTVSGTSISFGSATSLSQGLYSSNLAHDPSSNKTVILGYTTANNGKVWLGTVSGTSISVGSAIAFPTTPAGIYGVFYDAPSNKIGFIVQTGGGPGEAYVGTVSGTSISFGSGVQFQSGISQGVSGYDSRVNKFTVACRSISSPYPGLLRIGTISGNTFSFASPVTFNSGETALNNHSVCFDSDQGTSIISFMDGGDGDIGKAIGFQASGSYVVTGQVASGGAATVDIVGTVSTNQSGLTAGQQYYVQTDGTLGLTAASPSVLAGTAISATKMLVKT